MKQLLVISMILISLMNNSCKKDCAPPTYPIEGLWIGTYNYTPGTTSTQVPQYFSFIIKPQGSLIVESQDAGRNFTATGTWTLSGNKLNCKYRYPTSVPGTELDQAATATFHNSGKLSSGVWYNINVNGEKVPELTQQGTFSMQRIN